MQANTRYVLYAAQIVAAAICACLFVLTLLEPQWIELLFDQAPDDGDGSLERWLLLGSTAIGAGLACLLAGKSRRYMKTVHASR